MSKNSNKLLKKINEVSTDRLRVLNIIAAVVLVVQGIVILALKTSNSNPVNTNLLGVDPLASGAAGHQVLASASRHLFDINTAYIVALFLFISAIFYIAVASFYRNHYESDLKKGINCARWAQYGLSGGIMAVTIGLLVGVYDLSTLITIFALTAIACVLGLVIESTKKGGLSAYIGIAALALPWIIFAIYLISSKVYGSGNTPAFIYWLYFTLLVLFAAFAANTYLIYKKKGNWAKYLYGEQAFIVLSLVAQAALAWQVFASAIR